jgi:hypothetical protein
MVSLTEPAPRLPAGAFEPFQPTGREIVLPVPDDQDQAPFAAVLEKRRSGIGGLISRRRLAELLWHSARVRERHPSGRFGLPWDQRPSASAGGLHVIHLLCLPLEETGEAGIYDPLGHALIVRDISSAVRAENRELVHSLTGAEAGTAIWFAADELKARACYENCEPLILRDAGAVAATMELCCAWLGLSACTLGSTGASVPVKFGLPEERFSGAGGILVGERQPHQLR